MELVKLGKKGQITIPKSVLRKTGIREDTSLMVEVDAGGAIVLRQVAVYPIEVYTEERVREFLDESRLSPEDEASLEAFSARRSAT
jgi:AbrB family looped-hinge helix DNA binding protein